MLTKTRLQSFPATLLNLLSLFLTLPSSLPCIVSPIMTLLMTITPLPLLAAVLHSQPIRLNSKLTRFWLTFGSAQISAVLEAAFGVLVVVQNADRGAPFDIVERVFLVLCVVEMITVFHRTYILFSLSHTNRLNSLPITQSYHRATLKRPASPSIRVSPSPHRHLPLPPTFTPIPTSHDPQQPILLTSSTSATPSPPRLPHHCRPQPKK